MSKHINLGLPIRNNRYLIIGSYALGVRPAKDIDIIVYKEDIMVDVKDDNYVTSFTHFGKKVECLLADNQESLSYILEYYKNPQMIAPAEVLFAIKSGHITYPHRQWDKHILDYHILKNLISNEDIYNHYQINKLAKLHKKSTEDRIGKQRLPKLKGITKEEFFDDFVKKYMDHDDIHQMVAHKERPMYTYMQPDPNVVDCSKELWEKFTYEEQIQCVLEEAYVIAIERHYLPTIKGDRVGLPPDQAFRWALMRICTTLCSGWFRQFSIDNYFTVLNNHNPQYFKLLKL